MCATKFALACLSFTQATSDNGRTALLYAACKGFVDVVALLLRHGANPNLTKNDGYSPLM